MRYFVVNLTNDVIVPCHLSQSDLTGPVDWARLLQKRDAHIVIIAPGHLELISMLPMLEISYTICESVVHAAMIFPFAVAMNDRVMWGRLDATGPFTGERTMLHLRRPMDRQLIIYDGYEHHVHTLIDCIDSSDEQRARNWAKKIIDDGGLLFIICETVPPDRWIKFAHDLK